MDCLTNLTDKQVVKLSRPGLLLELVLNHLLGRLLDLAQLFLLLEGVFAHLLCWGVLTLSLFLSWQKINATDGIRYFRAFTHPGLFGVK